jgi:hypothetical protein
MTLEYIIVQSAYTEKLQELVTEKLLAGWRPVGGVVCLSSEDSNGYVYTLFAQALMW